MRRAAVALLIALPLLAPDARANSSVSCGSANRGALAHGVELPDEGHGWVRPEPWRSRGLRYGTAELVGLIERAAATVEAEHPGALVGVADMSRAGGGHLPGHRSHQSGRDVDLVYYAVDADGRPMRPDEHMAYYDRRGRAVYARLPVWTPRIPERYFDRARNWALVKALLTDPEVAVERIFVSPRIERWLIEEARARGEDPELVARAQRTLLRPTDSDDHNDHLHVRVACSEDDVSDGRCRDWLAPRKSRRHKHRARVRCPRAPAVL